MRASKYDQCRHGEPEDHCASCAACAACDGSCGTCPYAAPDPTATPRQDGAGLTALVLQHREAEVEGLGGWVMACVCGWVSEPLRPGDDQWAAHVAAALTARLSEPDVVVAARLAIGKHAPMDKGKLCTCGWRWTKTGDLYHPATPYLQHDDHVARAALAATAGVV